MYWLLFVRLLIRNLANVPVAQKLLLPVDSGIEVFNATGVEVVATDFGNIGGDFTDVELVDHSARSSGHYEVLVFVRVEVDNLLLVVRLEFL